MVGTVSGEAKTSTPSPDAARIGRRIATACYWLLAVFVIGSGIRSAVPQIFWPEASVTQVSAPEGCDDALGRLDADIRAGVRAHLDGTGRFTSDDFTTWDRRFLALHDACHTHPAYAALHRARHALETEVERFDDEVAPLAREVERELASPGESR